MLFVSKSKEKYTQEVAGILYTWRYYSDTFAGSSTSLCFKCLWYLAMQLNAPFFWLHSSPHPDAPLPVHQTYMGSFGPTWAHSDSWVGSVTIDLGQLDR